MKKLTFRHYFMVFGTLIALLSLFGTAPGLGLLSLTFGADVLAKLSSLPAFVFGVGIIFISLKALFDYSNGKAMYEKAMETSIGAGLAMVAKALTAVAVALATMALIATFS